MLEDARKLLERVRKTAPFNEHAKALVDLNTHLVGIVESQAETLAQMKDTLAKLTPAE